jgi:protein ImuA
MQTSSFIPTSAVPQRPDVWRGDALVGSHGGVCPSGHASLDAELPGGGWPAAGLTELLQAREACHDWRLLEPALARMAGAQAGTVALIGAPDGLQPFVPSLVMQGLPAGRLLWIPVIDTKARLWAAEQALRCADVPAVLAWLPQARPEWLRRLHMAAMAHGKPLFAFRPAQARHESSAAPLRLLLDGSTQMQVLVFKRRGPPMAEPLLLPAQTGRLAALLALRRNLMALAPAAPHSDPRKKVAHGLARAVTA